MARKILYHLFSRKITIAKWQFNLFGTFCISIGLIIGSYLTIAGIKKLFALTETSYTISSGGNTALTSGSSSNLTVTGSLVSLAPSGSWYNSSWSYKKQLTITNNSSVTINQGTPIQISVDTSSLESVLANCNDLRVVYNTATDLSRTYILASGATNCSDSKATIVTFILQADLSTGASDSTNYALYYGYASASAPSNTDGFSFGNIANMFTSMFAGTTTASIASGSATATATTGAIRYSGTKSALSFDGANDSVAVGNVGTGIKTVEFWVYPTATTNYFIDLNGSAYISASGGTLSATGFTSPTIYVNGTATTTIAANTWSHVAVVTSTGINASAVNIGIIGSNYFAGKMDEVRISDSERYSTTFTAPTAPLIRDSNTKLLFHLDENGSDPRNTGKAIDDSGNGNHGTVSGAKYVGGLVGVDSSTSDIGYANMQSYASHQGVFLEEATTNKITNPSFEDGTTGDDTNAFNDELDWIKTDNTTPADSDTTSTNGRLPLGNGSGDALYTATANVFIDDDGSYQMWYTGYSSSYQILHATSLDGSTWTKYNNTTPSVSDTTSTDGRIPLGNNTTGDDYYAFQPSVIKDGSTYKMWYTGYDGSIYRIYYATSPDALAWTKYDNSTGGAVIGLGSSGTGDDAHVGYPSVIKDGSTYKMWYAASDGTNWRIYYATSSDGISWTKYDNSVPATTDTTSSNGGIPLGTNGTGDDVYTSYPNVIKDGSTYKMWYSGDYYGGYNRIYYATSSDGISWTKYDNAYAATNDNGRLTVGGAGAGDTTYVFDSAVVKVGSTYKMYYTGWNGTNLRIFQATSSDGLTWTKTDNTIPNASNSTGTNGRVPIGTIQAGDTRYSHFPTVLKDGSTYRMWYIGYDGVSTGYRMFNATSSDGSTWTKTDNSVQAASNSIGTNGRIPLGVTGGDTAYIYGHPAVIKDGSTYKMWYGAYNNVNYMIYYATSPDGLTWTKYNNTAPSASDTSSTDGRLPIGTAGKGDVSHVYCPSVIKDGSTYKMWYTGYSSYWRIYYATSTDGLVWTKYDNTIPTASNTTGTNGRIPLAATALGDSPGAACPSVVKDGNAFKMWYTGQSGGTNNYRVFYATSPDGLTWTKYDNTIPGDSDSTSTNGRIPKGTSTKADSSGLLYGASVIRDGNTYKAWYGGYDNSRIRIFQAKAVLSSSTINTSKPKFGSNSWELTATGADAKYTSLVAPGNTNTHMLSAYIYNATAGSVGGTVDSTIAKLVYGGSTVTPTYTDMGSGWWRLTYSAAAASGTTTYGIYILSGMTIYVDGLQLEEKAYATTYADGSLGTGYAWSGTAQQSTSTRTAASLVYPVSSNISAANGSVSVWVKTPWAGNDGVAHTIFDTDTSAGTLRLQKNSSNNLVLTDGTNSATVAVTWSANTWQHIVATWTSGALNIYLNGSAGTPAASFSAPTLGTNLYVGQDKTNANLLDGVISDFRIYANVVSSGQVTHLYQTGLIANQQPASSNSAIYEASGTWTSPVIDLTSNAQWGASPNFVATQTLSGNTITYDVRTSVDNSTWSSYSSVTGSAPNFSIAATAERYVQIRATLTSTNQSSTPSFSSLVFSYVEDTTAPTTNATNAAMLRSTSGPSVSSNGWTGNLAPKFTWTAGADNDGGSGLKGYCLYLGTSSSGNPATSKGLLGTSPVSIAGSTCQFIVADASIDFATSSYRGSPWLTTSDSPYYLNIKAIDNTGNVFGGSSAQFQFRYDSTVPANVTYTSCASGNFSNVVDMSFSWPSGSSDANSDVLGWQYQINSTSGTWHGTTVNATLGLDYIPATASAYTLLQDRDGSSINSGANVIYFRTVDNAGNASTDATIRSCNLSYGGAAPSFGGADLVTVTPSTATSNSYALSWPEAAPSGSNTVAHYYYMVNTSPPSTLATLQGNTSTYIDNGTTRTVAAAALSSVNKGSNTVYVVAIDNATTPNYSPSNYISGTFTLNSTDPDNVENLVASDSSIKSSSQWNVTLTWTAPSYQGAGNLSYLVKRSTDNSTFTQVGTSTGLSYVDNAPSSALYYYKVFTKDGANAQSSGTNAVSITPTGKWTTAPALESGPTAGSLTTKKATITWSTSRTADSKVQFGTGAGSYNTEEPSNSSQVTSHSINLTGLTAGTTYYYRAKWTDEDGNTETSSEKSFTTTAAPSVKEVTTKSIGLTSGIVQFTTTNASKVKIYYGKSTAFGGIKEVGTTTSEATYTSELSGLEDGVKYYYKLNSFDADSNEYEGNIYSFETLPRPKIGNVRIQQVLGAVQATLLISWTTNTEVSSIVTYYPEGNLSQARDEVNVALTKGEHRMIIRGLLPLTNYLLVVKGRDKIGNEATSDSQRLTTATDTRPPQISELHVEGSNIPNVGSTGQEQTAQLIVSWNTDEPATSQVEFGEGTGVNYSSKTQEDSNLTFNHIVIISGLTPSKVYHLRTTSKDKADNIGRSIDTVTITPKTTENALNLVISNLQSAFGFLGGLR